MALFKKYRLVDESEIDRVIEKRLRQYDPNLHSMALLKKDMTDILSQKNLYPEEKLNLYKANQNRFGQLNKAYTNPNISLPPAPPPTPSTVPEDQVNLLQAGDSFINSTALENTTTPLAISVQENQLQSSPKENDIESGHGKVINNNQEEHETKQPTRISPIDKSVVDKLPPRYNYKASSLILFLENHSDRISYDKQSGEAILNGVKIPHSSMKDLISSLYVQPGKLNLQGKAEFNKTFANLLKKEFKGKINSIVSNRVIIKTLENLTKQIPQQKGKGLSRPPGKSIRFMKLY